MYESNFKILVDYKDKKLYWLKSKDELDIIKGYNDESYWLVYYYLILNDFILFSDLDNSIEHYLIPKNVKT